MDIVNFYPPLSFTVTDVEKGVHPHALHTVPDII